MTDKISEDDGESVEQGDILARLVQRFEEELKRELTPLQRERLMQLANRVEVGEVSEHRYKLYDIEQRIVDADEDVDRVKPLRRADLKHDIVGVQAVIVFPEEPDHLEYIKIVKPDGGETIIGSECCATDDVLILYPEDLGE